MSSDLLHYNDLVRQAYDMAAVKYDALFRNELTQKPFDRQLFDQFADYFQSS